MTKTVHAYAHAQAHCGAQAHAHDLQDDRTPTPRKSWQTPRLDAVAMTATRQVSKGAAPSQDPIFAPDAMS